MGTQFALANIQSHLVSTFYIFRRKGKNIAFMAGDFANVLIFCLKLEEISSK